MASSGGCQKISFGLPFYGYAWRLENSRVNDGLFAPVDGTANRARSSWSIYQFNIWTNITTTTTFDEAYVVNYFNVENTRIAYNYG